MTIDVIAKTIEMYVNIIVNRTITFIDSNKFYKGTLDTHASNLDDKDFKYLMSELNTYQLEVIKGKDAYLYEWVDSYKTFNYPSLTPE